MEIQPVTITTTDEITSKLLLKEYKNEGERNFLLIVLAALQSEIEKDQLANFLAHLVSTQKVLDDLTGRGGSVEGIAKITVNDAPDDAFELTIEVGGRFPAVLPAAELLEAAKKVISKKCGASQAKLMHYKIDDEKTTENVITVIASPKIVRTETRFH